MHSWELLMNNFMNRSRTNIVLVIGSLAISLGGLPGTLYPMMQTVVQQAKPREVQDGWMPLHMAASKGTRTDIEQLLAQGARKDAEDNKGRTPLFIAVEFGNSEAARALCEAKADCTIKEDEHGMTPLHVASWKGLDSIAEILLANGASVDEIDKNKKTPLHVASTREVVKVLLTHNAQPLVKDKAGLSPFDAAVKAGNRELVKAFLAGSIALRSADEEGVTALHRVAQCGTTPDIIKILLAQGGDVLSKTKKGMIPLHVAAFVGTKAIVETLLPLDASQVKASDKDGETPLHWASFAGHADIADVLITAGADIQALNLKRMIPLHWACEKGAEALARLLVARKSDVNAKAGFGETPLHRAAGGGYTSLVEFLLNNGARVNEIDNTGKTAHALAAKKGHKAVAAVLVAFGAEVREQSNDSKHQLLKSSKQEGAKAFDAFRGEAQLDSKGNFDFVGSSNRGKQDLAGGSVPAVVSVSRVGSNSSPQLMPTAVSKQEIPKAVTAPLLPSKPPVARVHRAVEVKPVRVLENGKENSLHKAVKKALIAGEKADLTNLRKLIAEILKKKKYTLDDLNPEGLSALMMACGAPFLGNFSSRYFDVKIVKILLTAGADVQVTGHDMKSALMHICDSHNVTIAKLELIKALLEAGADINVRNAMGQTPLMWFLYQNNGIESAEYAKHRKLLLYDLMRDMFKRGADVNDKDNQGNSILILACKVRKDCGDSNIIKILLEAGANVSAVNNDRETPLHSASRFGHIEAASHLVEAGADVNAVNRKMENALMLAARWGHEELVKYVVPLVANINQASTTGETALSLVCDSRPENIALITFLVEAGADIKQILPSVYVKLSSDTKFMLERLAAQKANFSATPLAHPNSGSGQSVAAQYARYEDEARQKEAKARWEKEEEHRKQAEADRRAQLAAEERGTNARVAGNVIGVAKLGANVLGGF